MDNNHTPPPSRSRSVMVDIALGVGRLEGMVGQALTTQSDHAKRLDDHDKRLNTIEKNQSSQKAYIAGIVAVVTLLGGGISWVIEHWDKIGPHL